MKANCGNIEQRSEKHLKIKKDLLNNLKLLDSIIAENTGRSYEEVRKDTQIIKDYMKLG